MTFKRFASTILSLAVAVGLAACGPETSNGADVPASKASTARRE